MSNDLIWPCGGLGRSIHGNTRAAFAGRRLVVHVDRLAALGNADRAAIDRAAGRESGALVSTVGRVDVELTVTGATAITADTTTTPVIRRIRVGLRAVAGGFWWACNVCRLRSSLAKHFESEMFT